ncbi:MAG: PIG-L deacetylase family protein [Candidatus Faecousia sp.]|nr:PIG-L family deacetylase [Clostridiales bacterium]MDY6179528.1 PIG-L deacetylase family protein [Candidatus Faecousia sp.]
MNYLIVVAHPDDEVLGAGALMYVKSRKGDRVDVCILSGGAEVRHLRPGDAELASDIEGSAGILGVNSLVKGNFPNIQLNTVPHLKLVQFIEESIHRCQPDVVITHHPSDTNNDHLHTSLACQAAIRLFQRRPEERPLRELWYMEVPSATEWSVNQAMQGFTPNTFVEVGEEGVGAKIRALSQYRDVMRPYPHPRSPETLKGLAACRGSQAGLCYAEAFQCVFRREPEDC